MKNNKNKKNKEHRRTRRIGGIININISNTSKTYRRGSRNEIKLSDFLKEFHKYTSLQNCTKEGVREAEWYNGTLASMNHPTSHTPKT